MFFHVMIGTNHLDRARSSCGAPLEALGLPAIAVDRHRAFWRTPAGVFSDSMPINGEPTTAGNRSTIGFASQSPGQVDPFHAADVAHGGTPCEEPPGVREVATSRRDIAYLRDPDGNKIRALHRLPEA